MGPTEFRENGVDDWQTLDLTWAVLRPAWARLANPAVISLDAVGEYEFAAISGALPVGSWQVRLRLGPTRGQMRLVTCDPGGERREPRSDLFPEGEAGEVIAAITVPADFTDMCLVIQKRDAGPGGVVILGADLQPSGQPGE